MVNRIFIFYILLLTLACKKEQIIPVTADYSYSVTKNNYTVPVKINFKNLSKGALKYRWAFEGGVPASSTQKNPGTIIFDKGGKHTITLEAWNDDEHKMLSHVVELDHAVTIGFDTHVEINNFAPAEIKITNTTIGANTYQWTFDGGSPASSTRKDPAPVYVSKPGDYTITLVANNGRTNFTSQKTITILPQLATDFDIVSSFADQEWHAPVNAHLRNKTVSGLRWEWSVKAQSGEGPNGAVITNPTSENTDIHFPNPGTYTLTLTASNGKESKVMQKQVVVHPNTNLLSFSDIQLGINTSLTHPVFFSTKLRRGFKRTDNLNAVGAAIDVVFYGQTANFNLNRFLCPQSLGKGKSIFNALPNSGAVTVMNVQKMGGNNLSVSDFDRMATDELFKKLSIESDVSQSMDFFGKEAPYIILYQTADGRKGAIKVKEYADEGLDSYIVVDIKVQKNAITTP